MPVFDVEDAASRDKGARDWEDPYWIFQDYLEVGITLM